MAKIKVLKASSFYDHYLENFYKQRDYLKDETYDRQYQEVMADCFGWYDIWKTTLEATGDYEVMEVITNASCLQKKWALENNINFSEDSWRLDILEKQILAFQPDIFFAHDFGTIDASFRKLIKKKCPSIKVIFAWDGVAANSIKLFDACDIVLSCTTDIVKYYSINGLQSHLFHFGFNSAILDKIHKEKDPIYDLSFCGSVSSGWHSERLDFLYNIHKKCKLDLWANYLSATPKNFLGAISRLDTDRLQDLIKFKALSKINHGQVFGLEMFQVMSDSKITLNKHINLAGNNAGNMRLFEAAGVGACLVTDYKSDLKDIFDIETEVVTYRTTDEAIDKIRYLLNNDLERERIALAGQKKVLEKYPVSEQIVEAISFAVNFLN